MQTPFRFSSWRQIGSSSSLFLCVSRLAPLFRCETQADLFHSCRNYCAKRPCRRSSRSDGMVLAFWKWKIGREMCSLGASLVSNPGRRVMMKGASLEELFVEQLRDLY